MLQLPITETQLQKKEFNMDRIIITGTKGFIGSNLKKELEGKYEILEINEDIFTDINLNAPASRISFVINNNNSSNIQLNSLSSMVLIVSHNNTITPIGPLYENININTLEYNNHNNIVIQNPYINAVFANAPIGYPFNISIKHTYTSLHVESFNDFTLVESTVNYGSYTPKP